jgi:hypothetical protein
MEAFGRMRKGFPLDGTDKTNVTVPDNPAAAYKPIRAIAKEEDEQMLRGVRVTGYRLNVDADGTKTVAAEFPGGRIAWTKYLERNLERDIIKKNGGPPGKYTVIVSFTVDNTGAISNIKTDKDPGYGSKEEAMRVIAKGPKWKPALDNDGRTISSVEKQSITFLVDSEPNPAQPLTSTQYGAPVINPSLADWAHGQNISNAGWTKMLLPKKVHPQENIMLP